MQNRLKKLLIEKLPSEKIDLKSLIIKDPELDYSSGSEGDLESEDDKDADKKTSLPNPNCKVTKPIPIPLKPGNKNPALS